MARAAGQSYDNRLAALARAMHQLLDEALAEPGEIESFRQAEALLAAASGLRGRAAKVKARAVLRLWRPRDVPLSEVARRLGISKQRAAQLAEQAKEYDGKSI